VTRRLRWSNTQPSATRDVGIVRMAELIVVADKDYLSLVRTSAMQVAALLDLPLPRVSDLRLAVDEACTSFLVPAPGREIEPAEETGATLQVCYDRYPDRLEVTVLGPAPPLWPGQDELGWEMLRAIIGDVRAEVIDGVGILTLVEPLPAVLR
jgi:hypothetical protein